jgi:hypothetical protein
MLLCISKNLYLNSIFDLPMMPMMILLYTG